MNEKSYMMLAKVILTSEMTEYFDLTGVCTDVYAQEHRLHFYLDEKDMTPEGYSDLTPNGFYKESSLNDFPIREYRTVLHVPVKHKKEAQKAQNEQRKQFKEGLKERHEKSLRHRKKNKRSRKPIRKNKAFVSERFPNGDTEPELLVRCRYSLMVSGDKWTATQKERIKLVFERYPDLEEAYSIVNLLRMIFCNPRATWIRGYESIRKWYDKVKAFGNDAFNTAANTIRDRKTRYSTIF